MFSISLIPVYIEICIVDFEILSDYCMCYCYITAVKVDL